MLDGVDRIGTRGMGVDQVEKRGAAEAAGGKKAPKERKKENRQTQTRDGGGGQGPHLHEQDFGRILKFFRRWISSLRPTDTEVI